MLRDVSSSTERVFATMKSLLLCLFVGLAFASTAVKNDAFTPDNEYLYHYDTQLLTGLPHTSKIYSGFRLSCHARVQFITYSKVRVQFEDVTFYGVNDPVHQEHAQQRLLPVEYLKELVGSEAETMVNFLKVPFGFKYSEGIVSAIALNEHETEWSANIKRGFTALFQMNLARKMEIKDRVESVDPADPKYAVFFKVMEESTLGTCVTQYTINKADETGNVYVTKSRDFKKCLDSPFYFKSIFQYQEKSDYLKDEPLLQEANMKYTVRGNTSQFVIMSAVSEGRVLFSPYKNQGEIMTSLNQTMYLRDVKPLSETEVIPEVIGAEAKRDNLRMSLPSEAVDPQDPFNLKKIEPKQLKQPADVYPSSKILLHLKLAAQDTLLLTSEQAMTHLRVVVDMLKTSPKEIIMEMWTILSNEETQDEISVMSRKIFWNVLPHIATNDIANVVLDICLAEYKMNDNCTHAIGQLALRVTPTEEIVDKLIILTDERPRNYNPTPSVKQAGYLALGTLGHKLNLEKKRYLEKIEMAENLLKSMTKETKREIRRLVEAFQGRLKTQRNKVSNFVGSMEAKIIAAIDRLFATPSFDDKVLALKSLANAGLQEGIPKLAQFLANPAEPQMLRLMAICGFRRMIFPEQARLLAINTLRVKVLDTSEKSEIRNMAFEIMSVLKPDLSTYKVIADYLRSEKDKHVSSYILSFFKSYANSTFPPHHEMKRNSSAALLVAPHERKPDMTSFVKQFSAFSEDYKLGGSWRFATIGDRNGYNGMALNMDTYVMGYLSEFLQVGINTEGMSRIFEKLWGPKGLLSHKKSIFDLLKRMPRDITPQQKIDEIFKLLHISPRTSSVPYGHLYVKLMGNELRYFDFTQALRNLLTEGKIPVKFDEAKLEAGLPIDINTMFSHFESQLTLATECGIPLSLKFQVQSALDIKGNVQFQVSPGMLEKEREGQPPVLVYAAVDLKPKVVLGIRGSVVIDMYYYKPAVGFSGALKTEHPLRMDLTVDAVSHKLQFNNYMQPQTKPFAEFLVRPFTQFQIIEANVENPILMQFDNEIYAKYGSRVTPISKAVSCDFLGYKLLLTGQMPKYLSKYNAIRPMNGRHLLNAFWQPTETAARQVTFNAQIAYPEDESEVPPMYAQAYKNAKINIREQDDEEEQDQDEEEMRDEERLYNKYGKPLASNLPEDIIPHSDPVNLNRQTFTVEQLIEKFVKLTGKSAPIYDTKDAYGLIMTLDASFETAQRHLQLESIFSSLLEEKYNVMVTRFWKSAIQGVSTQPLQMFIENVLAYPTEVFEPKDILDPKKQAKIMNELQQLISLDTHKVVNQILNMTVLTQTEQYDYQTLRKAVDDRVTRNLVTEQLYELLNTTGVALPHRQWASYWEDLLPLMKEVTEDRRVMVERSYVKQEAIILEQLTKLQRIQSRFLVDLDEIISQSFASPAELPILQAINQYQAKTAYLMEYIIEKSTLKGLVSSLELVKERLTKVLENLNAITQKVTLMFASIDTKSSELSANNKPVEVYRIPVQDKRRGEPSYFDRRPSPRFDVDSSYDTDDSEESQEDISRSADSNSGTLAELVESLYYLSHSQVELIKKLEGAIYKKEEFQAELLAEYIKFVKGNLTLFDEIFAAEQTPFKIVKETMLLVTVQDNYITMLYQKYTEVMDENKRPEGRSSRKVVLRDWQQYIKLVLKSQGFYLAERSSMIYLTNMYEKVLLPYLEVEEVPVYRKCGQLMSELLPQMRTFEMVMAYNVTAMRTPEDILAVYQKVTTKMDNWIIEAINIQKDFQNLPGLPRLQLVSGFIDNLQVMKRMTEFARTTLISLQDSQRLVWIEKLNKQSTTIQSLLSSMSMIYTKYTEENEEVTKEFSTILPRLPVNIKVLDLQDVRVRQNIFIREIKKYVRNTEISNTDLTEVLEKAIDRISHLQDVLKREHKEVMVALDETKFFQRESISATYTEVLYKQSSLYEIVKNAMTSRRDRIYDVSQQLNRIQVLERALSKLRDEKDRKMTDIRAKNVEDMDISQRLDENQRFPYDSPISDDERNAKNMKKSASSNIDITRGVEGFMNITWGYGELLDKEFHAEFLTSRSVEQMLYIYGQINAVARSHDITKAIDNRLSGETWKNDAVLRSLNSYNHWHLVAHFDKTTLPAWLVNYAKYLQEYLKVKYWDQYSRQAAQSSVQEGEFHVMMDKSDLNKQSDLYILTDSETNTYLGLEQRDILKYLPKYEPYQESKPKHYARKCILNKNKVFTMDKVTYELPPQIPKCNNVLAMDCSIEKAFAMTIVKANTTYKAHNLRILAGNKEIEIIPGELSTTVKVDGRYLVLEEKKPVVVSRDVQYGEETPVVILKRTGMLVEVELPLYGVYASLEGDYIDIEVSRIYKKKLCGLCSNFDNQLSWEYEGPRKELYTTPTQFAYSYILREGECPINARPLDKTYRPKGSSGRFEEPRENHPRSDSSKHQAPWQSKKSKCQPKLKTDIKNIKSKGLVCFSKVPLKKCPVSCGDVKETRKEKVRYICLDKQDKQVKKLRRERNKNKVIDLKNTKRILARYTRKIEQPVRC